MRRKFQAVQAEDYPVWQDENGTWYVGDYTPFNQILPQSTVDFITGCSFFKELHLVSNIEHDDEQYRIHYFVKKSEYSGNITYREFVDTRGDFSYEFQRY